MLKGLGRSPFGPRAPGAPSGGTPRTVPPPPLQGAPEDGQERKPADAGPSPAPPPPPVQHRKSDAQKEVDPAQAQYEALKSHIHMRLVDRLDMNRIAEIDPKSLRNDIRGVVEQLCDTENPL